MKPKDLYRGIVLGYRDFQDVKWYDSDIRVHYEPLIDEYGRKIVSDGNEYGVYMSDNLDMVLNAYGNPRSKGTPLENSPQLIISGARSMVNIPSIGIVYHINTDGMDIREPFICDALGGHYNNGFYGKEWIADVVPKGNIEIVNVKIARDLLHNEQVITNEYDGTFKEQVDKIIKDRVSRLQELANELEKLPESKRIRLSRLDMEQYKPIFGENGYRYVDLNDLKIQNAQDVMKYMCATICQRQDIDMASLQEIDKLKPAISELSELSDVKEALIKRLESLTSKRSEIEQNGFSPEGVVLSIQRIEGLMDIYETCLRENGLSIGNQEYEQEIDVEELFDDQEIDIEDLTNDDQEIDIDALCIEQESEIYLDSLANREPLGDRNIELDFGDVEELDDFERENGE